MAKAVAKDVFTQFAGVRVDLGNPTTGLQTAILETGLSVRGGLAWLIHFIQWWVCEDYSITANVTVWAQLSTQQLTNTVHPNARGILDTIYRHGVLATNGQAIIDEGAPRAFTPPVVLAAPRLLLHAQTDVDETNLRGKAVVARIGYTTVPLDAALWQEIAETWGW